MRNSFGVLTGAKFDSLCQGPGQVLSLTGTKLVANVVGMDTPTSVTHERRAEFRPDTEVEVTIAPNAGACFGVVRAIKLGHQASKRANREPVYSFGPLVHNPMTIEALEKVGVQIVTDAEQVKKGTIVLRSHGVKQEIESDLKQKGMNIVDATCPLVKKPQRIASALGSKGYFLVLVGDEKHPEVQGVLSYFGRKDYLVTYNPEAISSIPETVNRVGIIAQTTIEFPVLQAVEKKCREKFSEVVMYNTICDATSIRQTEAEALAQKSDVMIIVGGRNSSNTTKLLKICKGYQPNSHLIEEISEIDLTWFDGKKKIGVTGGASTPQDFVDHVGEFIAQQVELRL